MAFITIRRDWKKGDIFDEVTFSGIDMGNGTNPITVKLLTEDTLVVKIPGGKHWFGNHQPQQSHPGQYQVWKVSGREDVTTRETRYNKSKRLIKLTGDEIGSFPLR